ncbi:MAG: hypothetical protein H7839_13790 [Magnetococcus sp. YQC-5]
MFRLFCRWIMLVLMVLVATPGWTETRFHDDFNRPNADSPGNGWMIIPNQDECFQTDQKKPEKPGKKSKTPTTEAETDPRDLKSLVFAEISEEIKKKTEQMKKKSGEGSDPQSPTETHGATARIRDGMLFFQYAQLQNSQMVQQEFPKKVVRFSYDFTPLYAMGGLDDRAWIGVRIYYLDEDGLILGEIRNFYYHAVFDERENTPVIQTLLQQGVFDGSPRHVSVDAQKILQQQLRGLDQNRIAKTRISLEVASGICESSVEGYVDNVDIVMEDVVQPFRVTREMLMEMTDLSVTLFTKDRHAFPGNWKHALYDKYGQEKINGWVNEFPQEVRTDLGRLTDYLAQRHQVTGKDAWMAAYALTMLLQSL